MNALDIHCCENGQATAEFLLHLVRPALPFFPMQAGGEQ